MKPPEYEVIKLLFVCEKIFGTLQSIPINLHISTFFYSMVPSYFYTNQFSVIASSFCSYLLLPQAWKAFRSRPINQKNSACHAIYFCSHHSTSVFPYFNSNLFAWICFLLCAHHPCFQWNHHEVKVLSKKKSRKIEQAFLWWRHRKRKARAQCIFSNLHFYFLGVSLHSLVQWRQTFKVLFFACLEFHYFGHTSFGKYFLGCFCRVFCGLSGPAISIHFTVFWKFFVYT